MIMAPQRYSLLRPVGTQCFTDAASLDYALGFVLPASCAVPVGPYHSHPNREVSRHLQGQVHEVGMLIVLDSQASMQDSCTWDSLTGSASWLAWFHLC